MPSYARKILSALAFPLLLLGATGCDYISYTNPICSQPIPLMEMIELGIYEDTYAGEMRNSIAESPWTYKIRARLERASDVSLKGWLVMSLRAGKTAYADLDPEEIQVKFCRIGENLYAEIQRSTSGRYSLLRLSPVKGTVETDFSVATLNDRSLNLLKIRRDTVQLHDFDNHGFTDPLHFLPSLDFRMSGRAKRLGTVPSQRKVIRLCANCQR